MLISNRFFFKSRAIGRQGVYTSGMVGICLLTSCHVLRQILGLHHQSWSWGRKEEGRCVWECCTPIPLCHDIAHKSPAMSLHTVTCRPHLESTPASGKKSARRKGRWLSALVGTYATCLNRSLLRYRWGTKPVTAPAFGTDPVTAPLVWNWDLSALSCC